MEYEIVLHFSTDKFLVDKKPTKIIVTGKQTAWYIDPISLNKITIDSKDLSLDFSDEFIISNLRRNDYDYDEIIKSLENNVREKIKNEFIKSIQQIYNKSNVTCLYNKSRFHTTNNNDIVVSNNTSNSSNKNTHTDKDKDTKSKSEKTEKKCKSCHKKRKNKKKDSCSSSDSSSCSDSDDNNKCRVCCNYLTKTTSVVSFPNLSIGDEITLVVGKKLCYTRYNSLICTGESKTNCEDNLNGGFKSSSQLF
jgi:hypothetical protein